jgi:hypothetical protein
MDTEMPDNKQCDKCKSDRLLMVYVQGRDMHQLEYKGQDYEGYMVQGLGLYGNYGDATQFKLCMECGKIQGNFPIPEENLNDIFNKGNDEDDM